MAKTSLVIRRPLRARFALLDEDGNELFWQGSEQLLTPGSTITFTWEYPIDGFPVTTS